MPDFFDFYINVVGLQKRATKHISPGIRRHQNHEHEQDHQ